MAIWQLSLLCAAFFVTGFLACSLLVLINRERMIDRYVDRFEREMYAPLLHAQGGPRLPQQTGRLPEPRTIIRHDSDTDRRR